MKIVTLELDDGASLDVMRALRDSGYTASILATTAAVRAGFAVTSFNVVIVAASSLTEHVIDAVRELRAFASARKTYVVMVCATASETRLADAYDAGIDAHNVGPLDGPLVLARLRSIARLLQSHGINCSAPIPEPLAPCGPVAALAACARSNTWRSAQTTMAAAAHQMFGLPATCDGVEVAAGPYVHAKSIALVSAADKLEVRIAIGADAHAAGVLAGHLFGDASTELASDLIGELTNLLMGVTKASLTAEALLFTAGLPQTISADAVCMQATHHQAFALRIGEAKLAVHIGLISKANETIVRANLREGMVIAKDIVNARGVMLLAGGTRLSLTMVERLGSMMGPTEQVEVIRHSAMR